MSFKSQALKNAGFHLLTEEIIDHNNSNLVTEGSTDQGMSTLFNLK